MDPISGFDIRLVFTLPPRDSTLQYKRNNLPCLTILALNVVMVPLNPECCYGYPQTLNVDMVTPQPLMLLWLPPPQP